MKFSIVIPIHNMPNKDFFLKRCLDSIEKQTFKDYEIVIVEEGKFAENTNAGIRKAKGEFIKFLLMDDWLADENSLQELAGFTESGWVITPCDNNLFPYWTNNVYLGTNHLGSPSCLMIKNDEPLFFDENLIWLVDCDYYKRLYDRYGSPFITRKINVNIGIHPGQMTHQISDETKIKEQLMMKQRYEKSTS